MDWKSCSRKTTKTHQERRLASGAPALRTPARPLSATAAGGATRALYTSFSADRLLAEPYRSANEGVLRSAPAASARRRGASDAGQRSRQRAAQQQRGARTGLDEAQVAAGGDARERAAGAHAAHGRAGGGASRKRHQAPGARAVHRHVVQLVRDGGDEDAAGREGGRLGLVNRRVGRRGKHQHVLHRLPARRVARLSAALAACRSATRTPTGGRRSRPWRLRR